MDRTQLLTCQREEITEILSRFGVDVHKNGRFYTKLLKGSLFESHKSYRIERGIQLFTSMLIPSRVPIQFHLLPKKPAQGIFF